MGGEHLDQTVVGRRGARHHEQPAGVAVEPVHDPGTGRITDVGDLGVAGQQAVDQGAVGVTGTGMHDQARGFGHHHDVVVLEPDHHFDRGIGHGQARDLRLAEELDHAAGLELAALADAFAVDQHRTRLDEVLHLASGPAGQQRNARSRRSPANASGTASCSAIAGFLLGAFSRCSRMSARIAHSTMRIAPTVMAESATLKVGKSPTCTKSTTAPLRKPGGAEQPVHQVPERTAEHEREPDHHQRVAGAAHGAHEDHRHDDGDDGEERRERLEQAERAPGVAHQHEADVVEQADRVVRQLPHRPPLAELVEGDDAEDDGGREEAGRLAASCCRCRPRRDRAAPVPRAGTE